MGGLRFAAFAIFLAAATLTGAEAGARQYAAIVVDARNGDVLHSRNADTRLHPASLTKMMTLYLAIEAVETGKLGLDQRVRVSRHAASMPASKVGFKAGQRVRVRDLIRSAAVRSANDSAVVLAEAIAGTEAEFAKLMTRRARELGLASTTFRNASGLTASGHLSTARDMALLGRRMIYDYPEYYNLFGRRSTRAFGKTIWTTNKLLSSYNGADGIKTGYTRAAGFNLAASAERGDKRVLAVMFGGSSSAARNRRVAQLLDMGFARADSYVVEVPPATTVALRAPKPVARPGRGDRGPSLLVAGARELGRALAPAAAHAAETPPERAPRVVAALVDPTDRAPRRAEAPAPRQPLRLATAGAETWAVQLGAYAERDIAAARLAAASFGAIPVLAEAERQIALAQRNGRTVYGARLTGLGAGEAREACAAIEARGVDCVAVPPGM